MYLGTWSFHITLVFFLRINSKSKFKQIAVILGHCLFVEMGLLNVLFLWGIAALLMLFPFGLSLMIKMITFEGFFLCEIPFAFAFDIHRYIFFVLILYFQRSRLFILKSLRFLLNYYFKFFILLEFLTLLKWFILLDILMFLVVYLFLYGGSKIEKVSLGLWVYNNYIYFSID